MLSIIGLGLDFKDLSVRSLEAIKEADLLLLEAYTSFLPDGYIPYLEKEAGKKMAILKRIDMEEKATETVLKAKDKDVALLIPGDPLIATMHHLLMNEARKLGVKTRILHSASAFTVAIGESVLDIYKFGPTATIPFWFENYKPTAFLNLLKKNLDNSEHTLLLLDIDQKNHRPMNIGEALEILTNAAKEKKSCIIDGRLKVILLANAGRADQKIRYVRIKEIGKDIEASLKGKALSLIVPAKMSFAEEENLGFATSS